MSESLAMKLMPGFSTLLVCWYIFVPIVAVDISVETNLGCSGMALLGGALLVLSSFVSFFS